MSTPKFTGTKNDDNRAPLEIPIDRAPVTRIGNENLNRRVPPDHACYSSRHFHVEKRGTHNQPHLVYTETGLIITVLNTTEFGSRLLSIIETALLAHSAHINCCQYHRTGGDRTRSCGATPHSTRVGRDPSAASGPCGPAADGTQPTQGT